MKHDQLREKILEALCEHIDDHGEGMGSAADAIMAIISDHETELSMDSYDAGANNGW